MTSLRGVVGVVRGSISSLSSVRKSTIRRMVDLRSMIDVGVHTVLGIGDFNFTPNEKSRCWLLAIFVFGYFFFLLLLLLSAHASERSRHCGHISLLPCRFFSYEVYSP